VFNSRIGRTAPRSSSAEFAAALRRGLARHAWWRAVVVAGAAAVGVLAWSALTVDVRDARRSWGSSAEVWVAVADHWPGEPIRAERRVLPVVAVAVGAVDVDPRRMVARQHLGTGEVINDVDVVGSDGPFALAPPGSIVVSVADPLVVDAPVRAPVVVSSEGIVLSDDGTVVGVVDGVIRVAVPRGDAPAVAAAAAQSLASLLFPVGTAATDE